MIFDGTTVWLVKLKEGVQTKLFSVSKVLPAPPAQGSFSSRLVPNRFRARAVAAPDRHCPDGTVASKSSARRLHATLMNERRRFRR